jgi:hypothetical protein
MAILDDRERSQGLVSVPIMGATMVMLSFRIRVVAVLVLAVASVVLLRSQISEHKVELSDHVGLSDDVQKSIEHKLSHSSEADGYVFDRTGKLIGKFKLSPPQIKSAHQDPSTVFANEVPLDSGSQISGCKKPVPTPPPGCVVCESGDVFCSSSFRNATKKKLPQNQIEPQPPK